MIEQKPLSMMKNGNAFGIFPDLIHNLRSLLGFSMEVVAAEGGVWGKPINGSSYNGLLGMLQREEADASATFASLTAARKEVFLF